jgi:hypothetical protein
VQPLSLWNERVEVLVSRAAALSFRLTQGAHGEGHYVLREGQVSLRGANLIEGLLYHDMPCCFESVVVREEGVPGPLLQRVAGTWPVEVDDDQLEMYPHLHYLEERKTGLPWRYERWYSLAGTFLVFESEQYFERTRPGERGKNWVRFIVQLRQVADLACVVGEAVPHGNPLLGTDLSAKG